VPCSRRNSLIGFHQEPTFTAKSFATFRKADDMIESVIGIIVIHLNAASDWCMTKIIRETLFFIVASALILPTPILLLAWVTGQTLREVIFR
jgi:hypothetical protein